ncbi:MAG: DUF4142 domain-containing protein [Thermoanaerobaculia bacterium]
MRSISLALAASALLAIACGPEEPEVLTDPTLPIEVPTAGTAAPPVVTVVTAQTFVDDAAAGGTFEVRLGRVAQRNGASADVREFGAMMVADHTAAGNTLRTLARELDLELATDLPEEREESLVRVNALTGATFDREYILVMVEDHQKAVDLFERATTAEIDPRLQEFARSTLPVLSRHLQRAQQIQATLQ